MVIKKIILQIHIHIHFHKDICVRELGDAWVLNCPPLQVLVKQSLCKAVTSLSGAELEVSGAGITREDGNEVEKSKDELESVSCCL